MRLSLSPVVRMAYLVVNFPASQPKSTQNAGRQIDNEKISANNQVGTTHRDLRVGISLLQWTANYGGSRP